MFLVLLDFMVFVHFIQWLLIPTSKKTIIWVLFTFSGVKHDHRYQLELKLKSLNYQMKTIDSENLVKLSQLLMLFTFMMISPLISLHCLEKVHFLSFWNILLLTIRKSECEIFSIAILLINCSIVQVLDMKSVLKTSNKILFKLINAPCSILSHANVICLISFPLCSSCQM